MGAHSFLWMIRMNWNGSVLPRDCNWLLNKMTSDVKIRAMLSVEVMIDS